MCDKLHPFEKSGCGIGPFKFVCGISLPSNALLEHNPFAHELQLREAQFQARSFGVKLGSCDHCGMALMNNCVIRDSKGNHFIVGCDCVKKTGNAFLGSKAKVAEAKFQRERNRERRQIAEEKWLASPSKQDPSKTNAQIKQAKLDAQKAKREAREREIEEKGRVVCAKWKFFVERLGRESIVQSNFLSDIVRNLKWGNEPTGRGLDICAEIFGKTFGRRNSELFREGTAIFWENIKSN